jgi:hypothetical protein
LIYRLDPVLLSSLDFEAAAGLSFAYLRKELESLDRVRALDLRKVWDHLHSLGHYPGEPLGILRPW